MSIEWTQVEEIIRDDARSRKAGPMGDCPTPDDLVRFVEGEISRKAKARTVEHLAGCLDCARIVQSLLRLSDEVDRLTGTPRDVQSGPAALLDDGEKSFRPPVGRRLALVGLASLAVIAVISVLAIRLFERPVVRGASGLEIKLNEPKRGEAIAAQDIRFRWNAVPEASRYAVDLFSSSLEKVWSSGPVSETSLGPPAEALRALAAGESYFWRVTAVMEEGREIVSKLSEFSIRE